MRFLLKLLFKLLGYVPINWYKNGMIAILTSTMSFYSVGIKGGYFWEKYIDLYEKAIIIQFILFWFLYFGIFYIVLDFLIRIIFHKWLKRRVYDFLKGRYTDSKIEHLKDLVDVRRLFISGITLPLDLGYGKRSEISMPEIKPISNLEKEEAITEIVNMMNVWVCIGIHLLITSIFAYQFNWILVVVISILGLVIMLFVYAAITVVIHNLEAIPVIQKKIMKSGN